MRGLRITIWSVWSWFVLGALALLWLPLMALVRLVTAPFDKGRYATGRLFRYLGVATCKANPLWRFQVTGPMPENPRNPYVVVANHESFVDILVLCNLPWEMKWLSKVEMFKIPVVGWLMRLAGDIAIERGTGKDAAAEALRQCRERLDRKVSVMIFPEGTRSKTGDLLPFKDGAFRLAIESGVPILPVAVAGTSTALRKHDWRMGESHGIVRALEPVSVDGLTLDDLETLKTTVRDRIAVAVGELRAEIAAA